MNHFLLRSLTFYLVAWLCLANFLFATSTTTPSTATATAATTTTTTGNVCFPPVGKFKTYTQVEYGTPGTTASQLLAVNFPQLFPNGIFIGANVVLGANNLLSSLLGGVLGLLGNVLDLVLVLTTADSVVAFLPQLTAPGCLTSAQINPASSPAGALAGDTVALALNVALDAHVASFASANFNLSDLAFVKGPCAGLSVRAVLNIANAILGKKVSPLLASSPLAVAANVDACLASCNQNFFDGIKADAFLALPGFNLQALLDVKLPLLSALPTSTVVKVRLFAPLPRSAGVLVDAQLLGLDAAAALTLAGSQRYHSWFLDATSNIALGVDLNVTGLAVAVPRGVTGLLSGIVGDATYVVDDLLCLVNYLLNFGPSPSSATAIDIQAAVYLLLNPTWSIAQLLAAVPSVAGCNQELVLAVVADVRLNGVAFIPAPGQLVGVVATVSIGGGVSARILLEVTVPALDVGVNTNLCVAI